MDNRIAGELTRPSLGSPQAERLASLSSYLRKYEIAPGGCWIFHKRAANGYAGGTSYNGRQGSAYRLIWEVANDQLVPEGMELHHTCHNGSGGCVNPFHLEVCTHQENMDRSHGIHQEHKSRTHCPQGHEYTPENTLRSRGRRYCKVCAKVHRDRWLERDRPPCSEAGCSRKKYARGLCRRCYERKMKRGEIPVIRPRKAAS